MGLNLYPRHNSFAQTPIETPSTDLRQETNQNFFFDIIKDNAISIDRLESLEIQNPKIDV